MNANEIDEYLNAIIEWNPEKLLEIAGIKVEKEEIEEYYDDNALSVIEKIMQKIEAGDFDYFYSKIDDPNYSNIISKTLQHSTNKNTAICILNNEKILEDMTKSEILDFIKLADDSEFTKSIINGTRKIRDIKLSSKQKCDLILSTKDSEFIKSILDNYSNGQNKNELDQNEIMELLKNMDKDYIISIIEDKEKRNIFEINVDNLFDLILATKDSDYIKSVLESNEKRDEIDFRCYTGYNLRKLIIATNDVDYIKSIIESKEKRDEIDFVGYIDYDLVELIGATNDSDYIKSIIESKEKRDEIGLHLPSDSGKYINLIEKTNDIEYIKSIIEGKITIEGFEIEKKYGSLICLTKDPEYMKSFIEDKDKREKYSIKDERAKRLIFKINQESYFKRIVEDSELRKELCLPGRSIINFIVDSKDEKLIKSIISDKTKIEEFQIEQEDIIYFFNYVKDEKFINDWLKEVEGTTEVVDKNRKINLPENMTIGVEIESEGEFGCLIAKCKGEFAPGWECKYDGSLEKGGAEVVSPILTGDTEKSTESIKFVCDRLNKLGQKVSERCGGHVHIGADYLTSDKSYANLLEIWGNAEKVLYIISNKEGEIPREGIGKYASPISSNIEDLIKQGSVELQSEEDLKNFAKKAQNDDRYSGINFMNLGNKKNTIEFRLANGTIDENTWIENINLFGGIIKAAEDIMIIQNKDENEITDEEKERLGYFEELKNHDLTDEQKLDLILSLTINDENRDIYRDRFKVNSKLIEENTEIKNTITEKIAKSSVDIKKVGKKVFTGTDSITGQDFSKNETIIHDFELKHNKGKNKEGEGNTIC